MSDRLSNPVSLPIWITNAPKPDVVADVLSVAGGRGTVAGTADPGRDGTSAWRMDLATRELLGTDRPIESIARRVGYNSEFALSKALTRIRDIPPAATGADTKTKPKLSDAERRKGSCPGGSSASSQKFAFNPRQQSKATATLGSERRRRARRSL